MGWQKPKVVMHPLSQSLLRASFLQPFQPQTDRQR